MTKREALPKASVWKVWGSSRNWEAEAVSSVLTGGFMDQGSGCAGVTTFAPAVARVRMLSFRPPQTALERSEPNLRDSKRCLMAAIKASVSLPARRRVRPGLVQN